MTSESTATTKQIAIGDVEIGGGAPLVFIAGPCVIESGNHCLAMARQLCEITGAAGVPLIFKASYDKANRSSAGSFRGPGVEEGVEILLRVKEETGLPILTDVHRFEEIEFVARVADVLQVPAFLSRQTDFVAEVARAGRIVNIKKGQFLAPWDMKNVIAKAMGDGNDRIILTERGASFGYNNLVADMRSLVVMRRFGYPVVFDATHSVQLPGGQGATSGGQREFVLPLARAAVAVGIDGLFTEVHDNPAEALCDGPNSLDLDGFRMLIRQAVSLSSTLRERREAGS